LNIYWLPFVNWNIKGDKPIIKAVFAEFIAVYYNFRSVVIVGFYTEIFNFFPGFWATVEKDKIISNRNETIKGFWQSTI